MNVRTFIHAAMPLIYVSSNDYIGNTALQYHVTQHTRMFVQHIHYTSSRLTYCVWNPTPNTNKLLSQSKLLVVFNELHQQGWCCVKMRTRARLHFANTSKKLYKLTISYQSLMIEIQK